MLKSQKSFFAGVFNLRCDRGHSFFSLNKLCCQEMFCWCTCCCFLSFAPRGFAARSRVLASLASLAQIGELARRLSMYLFDIQTRIHAASRKGAQARLDLLDTTLYTTIHDASALGLHPKQCLCATVNQTQAIFITFKSYPINSQSYELVRDQTVICTNITIREEVRHSLSWPGIACSRLHDSSAVMQSKVMRKTCVGCIRASYFRVACFIFATSFT